MVAYWLILLYQYQFGTLLHTAYPALLAPRSSLKFYKIIPAALIHHPTSPAQRLLVNFPPLTPDLLLKIARIADNYTLE